jgi:hypothetical protein
MASTFEALNAPQIRKDNLIPRLLLRSLLAALVAFIVAVIIGNSVEAAAYVAANL